MLISLLCFLVIFQTSPAPSKNGYADLHINPAFVTPTIFARVLRVGSWDRMSISWTAQLNTVVTSFS